MSAVAHWAEPTVVRAPVRAGRRGHLALVPARPSDAGLRLTVRGRRVVAALMLALLAAGGWGAARALASGGESDAVVVQPGQTLSQVAHSAYPKLPIGEAVVRVQLANGLNSLDVQAGQSLRIPR